MQGQQFSSGEAKGGPPIGDVHWVHGHCATGTPGTGANVDEVAAAAVAVAAVAADGGDDDDDDDDDRGGGGGDDDDDDAMSAAFLEFIAQSAAHRKERDRKKQAAEKKRLTGQYASAPDPAEAPGTARRRHYAELYGADGANAVQAMEARANLAHDKLVDAHCPTLWPALPLNM